MATKFTYLYHNRRWSKEQVEVARKVDLLFGGLYYHDDREFTSLDSVAYCAEWFDFLVVEIDNIVILLSRHADAGQVTWRCHRIDDQFCSMQK
ncbi:MAG: hypothetical protein EB165_06380 [Euryarchaeota archaeon]|nr:hypothetical protein [Euryarchaeota archaeon]NDB94251.1 hypothetical protein [Euryarchaeota archaeon]